MGKLELAFNEFLFESDYIGSDGFCMEIIVSIDFCGIIQDSLGLEDCFLDRSDLSLENRATGAPIELNSIPVAEMKHLFQRATTIFQSNIEQEWIESKILDAENYCDSQVDR
jgi:hypothetical protein